MDPIDLMDPMDPMDVDDGRWTLMDRLTADLMADDFGLWRQPTPGVPCVPWYYLFGWGLSNTSGKAECRIVFNNENRETARIFFVSFAVFSWLKMLFGRPLFTDSIRSYPDIIQNKTAYKAILFVDMRVYGKIE